MNRGAEDYPSEVGLLELADQLANVSRKITG
jgi:hypothetical protein